MSAWTPGPWTAVNRGSDEEPMYSVMAERIRGRGPTHEVAICATGDSPQPMETANAHLIAAAPDLYAALDDLLKVVQEPEPLPGCVRDDGAQVQAAHKALARARGEMP